MWRKLALLAAFGSVAWLSTALALGLGEIEVKSGLNQRFVASIPLIAASAAEAEGAQVSLASNAEFQRAGVDRSEYLSSLRFTVQTEGGAPRIEVRSTQIAREPLVNFLVEVRTAGGRLLREYTVLLDPPNLPLPPPVSAAPYSGAPASSSAAAPAPRSEFFETTAESSREPSTAPSGGLSREERSATSPAASGGSGGSSYGPVQPGETFWSIATRLRPDPSVTMDQMLLAIYSANRGAFDGGINGLRVGTMLSVPPLAEIIAVSPSVARSRVNALRSGIAAAPREPRSRPSAPPSAQAAAPQIPQPPAPPAPSSSAPRIEAPPPAPVPPPRLAAPVKPAPAAPAAVPVPPPPPPAPAPAPPMPVPVPPPAAAPPPAVEPPPPPVAAIPAPEAAAAPPATPVPPEETFPETTPEPAAVPPPLPVEEEAGPIELLVPVIGLLLVLGGIGYFVSSFLKKRRLRAEEAQRVPTPPPAVTPSLAKPLLGAAAAAVAAKAPPERPQDAARRELESLSEGLSEETENFATRQLQTQQILPQEPTAPAPADTVQLPTFDSTQAFGASDLDAARKAVETGNVDFDVTGQFATETVQINLDAGDPLAEADFHLAYGLYDEAILLLKQAAEKDPARTELRVKLAETYFAAGRPQEFQATAEQLQSRVDPSTWQKIAIMGQQLCPDAPIFAGGDLGSMSADVDLAFDEPAGPAGSAPPASAGGGDMLDFKLEELELPQLDAAPKREMPEMKRDDALEFDLGDFDLGAPETPAAAPAPSAAAGNAVEFELESLDLGGFDEPAAKPAPAPAKPAAYTQPSASAASLDALKLEDFEVGDFGDSDSISAGDEAATKLDLARAYVDMGDNDMARGLLNEVVEQGTDTQKGEARTLLARLG